MRESVQRERERECCKSAAVCANREHPQRSVKCVLRRYMSLVEKMEKKKIKQEQDTYRGLEMQVRDENLKRMSLGSARES